MLRASSGIISDRHASLHAGLPKSFVSNNDNGWLLNFSQIMLYKCGLMSPDCDTAIFKYAYRKVEICQIMKAAVLHLLSEKHTYLNVACDTLPVHCFMFICALEISLLTYLLAYILSYYEPK